MASRMSHCDLWILSEDILGHEVQVPIGEGPLTQLRSLLGISTYLLL